MDFGYIFQLGLFALLALAILLIVAGMLRAVPRPHKIKAYRYSKSGDDWITKYPSKKP